MWFSPPFARHRNASKPRRGFTLLELILALALTIVFAAGLAEVWVSSLNINTQISNRAELEQENAEILSLLSTLLRQAQTASWNGNKLSFSVPTTGTQYSFFMQNGNLLESKNGGGALPVPGVSDLRSFSVNIVGGTEVQLDYVTQKGNEGLEERTVAQARGG